MSASAKNSEIAASTQRPHQPLVIVLIFAVAGIVWDRYCPMPLYAWWIAAVIGVVLWFLLWRIFRHGRACFAILLSVAAVGGAWHHCCWHLYETNDIGRFARRKAQPVCVEAVVRTAPRAAPPKAPDPLRIMPPGDYCTLTVDVTAIRDGQQWRPASGRASLVVRDSKLKIAPGDRLRCFAALSAPARPQNPGASDRSVYPRANRVLCRLMAETPEDITIVATGSPWTLTRLLDRMRAHGRRLFDEYLDPRQADLASAVLLGLREELDDQRNEAFFTTGTVHILSISGLHVGILAAALFWIAQRTPLARGLTLTAVAMTVVLYAMMVDVEPPVVRATVLVLIACCGWYFGSLPLGMNSLAAAALVVLALNPSHLFHIGAQLSFICVAGLIWIALRRPHADDEAATVRETLNRLIRHNWSWWRRRLYEFKKSVVGLTLAGVVLWLLTLPLIMARFHLISPAGLILNVILWIPMTIGLLSGFGVLVFGTVCPPLCFVFAWLCNASLYSLELCVNFCHQTPYSHFWIFGPNEWWLFGLYSGLAVLLAVPQLRKARVWCAAALIGWIAVGLGASAWRNDASRLDCTFLSMGHGAAVYMELPSGQNVLYDAGQLGLPDNAERTIAEFLWNRGVWRVDCVVLSHPDVDHFNALPGLLEKFSIGEICVSPSMFAKENRTVGALRKAIDQFCIPVREVAAGDRIFQDKDCRLEVLHPPRRSPAVPGNHDSVVLSVGYRGRTIILPGDLESPGLEELLAQKPRPSEVLLAPHHGSRKSNSPGLAAWCRPRAVVFSGDGRWSLPEIERPYRSVGAEVYHTYDGGAIQVVIRSDGVEVSEFMKPKQPSKNNFVFCRLTGSVSFGSKGL